MKKVKYIELIGNVGEDPRLFTSALDNSSFVTFSLAVTEKNKAGEKVTEWFKVNSNNESQSKTIMNYVKKGMRLIVEGGFKLGTYQDKQGVTKPQLTMFLDRFLIWDNGSTETKTQQQQHTQPNYKPSYQNSQDIPF